MKKIIIGAIMLGIVATTSAGVLNYGTLTWEYNKDRITATGPTEKWEKDLKSGKTSYEGSTINWSMKKDGSSIYETPTIKLEQKGDYIKYTASTITYEKKGGDIIYTTPTTTLTIGKDKIKYVTPTETKEIDGGDWKVTSPTSEYSN